VKVAVTGSHGLIGSALVGRLRDGGHDVVRVVRSDGPGPGEIAWDPAAGRLDPADLVGVDAVVNLAGAGLGERRWNAERKAVLVSSRVAGTELLARTMAGLDRRPDVLVSASAVGFYGDRGDEVLTERSTPGTGFLADLCVRWEAATAAAEDAGIRTVHIRSGIVLASGGGALARQLPFFRVGLGGRLGRGQQYWSWITLADEVSAIVFALSAGIRGAANLAAPNPVTNAEVSAALGRALHRPAVVPVPAPALRLVMGAEMAREVALASQRATPGALTAAGFTFTHPTIDAALAAVLG
jgi:uncharacterized protein